MKVNMIPGYEIKENLYESHRSIVFRATRSVDKLPVVLKALKNEHPPPEEIARFKLEYELTQNLELEGVIKAYNLEKYGNSLAIAMEDFGGTPLSKLVADQETIDQKEFLSLSIQIADALGAIHNKNIIHKDINPSNIVFNKKTGKVKIIDFGISTELSRENPGYLNPNVLEGTLSYISPEQTGRMNRDIDHRTDFYSLGVTFYKILVGSPPFHSEDAMELVHSHIAKIAPSPHTLNRNIPETLSAIVMKLMAKTVEERYQSAFGLKYDLTQCLNRLRSTGNVGTFTIGTKDVSDKFHIPQKLYGRGAEVKTLLDAFERVCGGPPEMILVSGHSGIGKTALIQEVHKPIVQKKGYFIEGKYDQFQRDIPYSAIGAAFRGLVGQLLGEPGKRLEYWKSKLLEAFGPNGGIISDIIPEVERIVGPQPEVPDLNPGEAQHRFLSTFRNFVKVFAREEHPLVIFLDDLQWGDVPSFALMEGLMAAKEMRHLFIIGAYRSNEVDEGHPLNHSIDEIRKTRPLYNLFLKPLEKATVNEVLSDTLHCQPERSQALAKLIHGKTEGNPFFLNEFLKNLYQRDYLNFLHSEGIWDWDVEKIKGVEVSANVVDFMIERLRELPLDTQNSLLMASCIGNHFDLNTIAIIEEQSPTKTARILWEAVKKGIIIPLDNRFRLFISRDQESSIEKHMQELSNSRVECKFQHDRVQQAAYALIEESKKKEVHLRIGRLMLKSLGEEEKRDKVIDIVRQLNEGRALIEDGDEREELARMNLLAAKKAKSSTAYKPALEYLKIGKELLPSEPWGKNYEFTFGMFREYAECAYLCGEIEDADEKIEQLLSHSKTKYDKAKIFQMKAIQYSTAARLEEAVEAGVAGLAELGVKVSARPGMAAVLKEVFLAKWLMRSRNISDLEEQPLISDPEIKLRMRILMEFAAPAYFLGNDNLLVLSIMKQVNLSLRHGNTPESACAYTNYGFVLTAMLGDLKRGYEFGKLGIAVNERLQDIELKCRILACYYFFIHHFHNHRRELPAGFKAAVEAGYQSGDLLYIAYSCHNAPIWDPSATLPEVLKNYKKYLSMIEETNYKDCWAYTMVAIQMRKNFCGQIQDRFSLSNEEFDADKHLERMKETKFYTGLGVYYVCKGQLFFMYEHYEEAMDCFNEIDGSEQLFNGIAGLPYQVEFFFFSSLALTASIPTLKNPRKAWKSLRKKLKQIKKWAGYCAENTLHLQLLVEAEIARLSGKSSQAIGLYNKAIKTARENEYLRDEAMANEFAAKFFIEQCSEKAGGDYLRDAHYGYARWGAVAKVKQLEEKYPAAFTERKAHGAILHADGTLTTKGSSSTPGTGSGGILDLATVMKSSQAISSEIRLETLLKTMTRIMMQNAGAQKGALILKDRGKFMIECQGDFDREEPVTLESIPVELEETENGHHLPLSIINYVNRTSENLVLDDAMQDGRFNTDAYILRVKPKSILTIPILHQAKLAGILYLENKLTTAAFTPERVETLQLLSAQAVTSLANARLYANLEHRVEERTRELKKALEDLHDSQEKLVQSEKMASLGQLVAGVAHEINTPIGIGITAASNFEETTNEIVADFKGGKMKKSSLERYLQNSKEAAKLILRNLLRTGELIQSFKLVSSDQASQERRKFGLKSYLEDIIKSLQPELKKPPIEVCITCPEEIELNTYPGPLVQVMTNLIMNSKMHGFKGKESGEIKIEAHKVDDGKVTISYSDNGHGIDEETLPKIFDPFFTTNRSGGGTGLGLHIIFNIVTQTLKGEIRCESKPGQGATFIVVIPGEIA